MSNTLIGWGEVSSTVASVAHQNLLRDRGDVNALSGEDMTERQTASADKMQTGEVVQVPLVCCKITMKPHGVIEARRE